MVTSLFISEIKGELASIEQLISVLLQQQTDLSSRLASLELLESTSLPVKSSSPLGFGPSSQGAMPLDPPSVTNADANLASLVNTVYHLPLKLATYNNCMIVKECNEGVRKMSRTEELISIEKTLEFKSK
eukprot:superscaffoldBa00007536_g22627